jgi:hypothetical protein
VRRSNAPAERHAAACLNRYAAGTALDRMEGSTLVSKVRISPSIARDLREELGEVRNGGGGTVRVAAEVTVSERGPLAALGRHLSGYVVHVCAVAVTGSPRGPAEPTRPPGKGSRQCGFA